MARTKEADPENPTKREKSLSVEESLEKLEELLKKLEDEDTPLEESFRLYEQGMKLVKDINLKIDAVEKKMIVLEGAEENA
jgi:exodeoxyribonuclease VII small subunit